MRVIHVADNQWKNEQYFEVESKADFEKLTKGLRSVIRRNSYISGIDDKNFHQYYELVEPHEIWVKDNEGVRKCAIVHSLKECGEYIFTHNQNAQRNKTGKVYFEKVV